MTPKRFGDFGVEEVQPIAVELVLQRGRGPVHGQGELLLGGVVDHGLSHGAGSVPCWTRQGGVVDSSLTHGVY